MIRLYAHTVESILALLVNELDRKEGYLDMYRDLNRKLAKKDNDNENTDEDIFKE